MLANGLTPLADQWDMLRYLYSVLTLLIKKWKPIRSILAASLVFVLAFGIYALSNSPSVYLALVPLWTCGEIIYNTTGGIFIASRAPEAFRARYQSLNSFAVSFGQCTAPMIMSHYLLTHGYLSGWFLVALVCLAAALLIALVYRRKNGWPQTAAATAPAKPHAAAEPSVGAEHGTTRLILLLTVYSLHIFSLASCSVMANSFSADSGNSLAKAAYRF